MFEGTKQLIVRCVLFCFAFSKTVTNGERIQLT